MSRAKGESWTLDEIQVADATMLRRAIAGTAIGNFMESYDFSVYSLVATILAQMFYPGSNSGSGNLIATFGTLAVAFVVRPLGGFIFGPLGDRIGRKPVLLITIALMTSSATATGLLPGYSSIGVWAPVLLVVVRLCQGLSTGGEYAGAMTYIVEAAPDRRRGMLAGFLPMGTLSGNVAAVAMVTGLQVALSPHDMASWGWRIPFFLALPLGLTAVVLRLRLGETLEHQATEDHNSAGSGQLGQIRRTITGHWRALLLCIGLELTICNTNYMLSGYLPTYLKKIVGLPANPALLMILLALAFASIAVVFVAKFSDRIGVKPLIATGCGLLFAGSVPAFALIRFGSGYPTKFVGVLIIGVMLLCLNSIEPSTLPALFPANVRYGGVSIGYNIAVSAFGGTIPLVAQTLISATGNAMMPAYMLMFAGVAGTITLIFTPEVAGRTLPGSAPTVESSEEAREIAGATDG
jgi:MFS transporter, MHS family, proline/betaine transporter